MKCELLKIFIEILNEWETSETIVINDRGSDLETDEYEILEKRKIDYIQRFNKAIQ